MELVYEDQFVLRLFFFLDTNNIDEKRVEEIVRRLATYHSLAR